jgi:CRP/FNR family transcriptional regulator
MSTQISSGIAMPAGANVAGRLATADADVLDSIGTRIVVGRGHALFREGDDADTVYRIVSGALRTSRLMPDGRRYVADFLFPGDFVGLNDGALRSTTADTLCDTILVRCSRRQFDAKLEADRRLGRMILSVLTGRLSNAQERMLLLGRKSAAERVASFLLMMADRAGGNAIELPMTRSDIADYLGLTIETISRIISRFKARNFIRAEGATTLRIQKREALEDLAECC